jgi:uncharacterized protein (DUF1684 family)
VPDEAKDRPSPSPADPAHDAAARAELDAWRGAHLARLAAPDGWWATHGLHWLDEGRTRVGASEGAAIALPDRCPPHAATLRRDGPRVIVEPAAPDALWVGGAQLDAPTVVATADRLFALGPEADAVRFAVLVRGDRRGVRTYDPALAGRRDPERDVAWYPVEPGWVLPARFDPTGDGETVPIVTMQGDVLDTPAAGRLHVRLHGGDHALLATWAGERLFVNLRDAGSGTESYGAGRYLYVDPPVDGATNVDFHRLHHPPCAHSPFATCPLPPLENRLPFVVRAGERTP